MSSFKGKIREIPGIFVDNFERPFEDEARAYFLSHYHTDHTVGLNKIALQDKLERNTDVFIYATKMTGAIIVYNNPNLKDYVRELNLGANLISVPGDDEKGRAETILNVTLIPAGHCLGSTMFLFETSSVKVLYTGDFRIRPNDLTKYSAFHDKFGNIIKLDKLYVDTTFINAKYTNFPKRSDSVEEFILWVKNFLESDNNLLILKTSATYGYEYVFNEIYKLLGYKVYVDDKKWTFYRTVKNLVPGVTNDANETRVFLNRIPEKRAAGFHSRTVRFSAMTWECWNENNSSINDTNEKVLACFPTHCSSAELYSFVEYFNLNTEKVEGFREPYIPKKSPIKNCTKKFILSPKRPLEEDRKVSDEVLRNLFA